MSRILETMCWSLKVGWGSRRTIVQKMQSPLIIASGAFRRRPEDPLRDNELLDLVRALVQSQDAGVPEVSFHVEIPAEPIPAMNLNRAVRHAHRHLRAEQLRHRDLLRVVKPEVPELRGSQREEARGLDFRRALRDHLPDELEVPDRAGGR